MAAGAARVALAIRAAERLSPFDATVCSETPISSWFCVDFTGHLFCVYASSWCSLATSLFA
ncbi:MAG TPA: hypothetical protein VLL57_07520, partial [Candidatus Binataceae bacterium]|nr:hypothetical protein [Candidatus Binataceae bacterium]